MPDLTVYDGPTDIEGISDDIEQEKLKKIEDLLVRMKGETVGLEAFDDGWSVDDVDVLKKKGSGTSTDACPSNAEEGDIFSDPGAELLWKRERDYTNPLEFVVCTGFPSRIRWKDEKKGKEFCFSSDAKYSDNRHVACSNCPDEPTAGANTACNNVLNWIILLTDLSGMYHVRFSGSGFGEGQKIRDAARRTRQLWDTVFELKTKRRSNDDYKWQMFDVGIASEKEVDPAVKATASFLKEQYQAAWKHKLKKRDKKREEQQGAMNDLRNEVGDELGDVDSGDAEDGEQGFENSL